MATLSSNVTRKAILVLLAVGLPLMSAGSARAAHRFTCKYTGTCYGFHSERHMVRALDLMQNAAYASHHDTHRLIDAAIDELRTAAREVQSHRTRHGLDDAIDHLRHYQRSDQLHELSTASRLIHGAIRSEQIAYRYSRGHHGHVGHGSGHGPYGHPVMTVRRGGISVGGRWGGVRISF